MKKFSVVPKPAIEAEEKVVPGAQPDETALALLELVAVMKNANSKLTASAVAASQPVQKQWTKLDVRIVRDSRGDMERLIFTKV